MNKYWKMSIVESVPSQNHIEYGIDINKAGLEIKENKILYGIEGTETISFFDAFSARRAKRKLFIVSNPTLSVLTFFDESILGCLITLCDNLNQFSLS